MQHGTKPITLDRRDLSYHGSYRAFGAIKKPVIVPFTVDKGLTMWDQNKDTPPAFDTALPNGCTGMTQADNLSDQYGTIAKPSYTYHWTCYMEGHDETEGCEIRTSMDSTQVYGVEFVTESTPQEAEKHRGGKYFNIYDDGGLDWFDGVLSAVHAQRVGASIGSPWFPSWEAIGSDGILPMPTAAELRAAKDNPASLPWHNWAVKGMDKLASDETWQVKSWQGDTYGDKGWAHMPREVANTVLEIRGAGAFIQPKYAPKDLYTIKVAVLSYAFRYMLREYGYLLN